MHTPQRPSLVQIRDSLLAGALGDAIGFYHEGAGVGVKDIEPASFRCSDDTQMTIALCRSLVRWQRCDPADVAAALLQLHREEGLVGAGASTLHAIQGLEVGGHWASVGRKGQHAAGNGAAVRVAPLAFFLDPTDYFDRRVIRDVAWISHHNDEAYAGALAIAVAVRFAWTGDWHEGVALHALVAEQLPDSLVREQLFSLPPHGTTALSDILLQTGSSGFVAASVPAAIAAAEVAVVDGIAAAFETILYCGGDTDSIASMCGQIAGARVGWQSLPAPWRDALPRRDELETLARELADMVDVVGV